MTMLPFRPRDDERSPIPDDAVTRALRAEYEAPRDGYWDALEARVLSAVTRAAAASQAPVEWWQALAGWTRPALAAAAVVLVAVGAAAMQARDARAHVAFQAVLDETPVDGVVARVAADDLSEMEDLLRAGVKRTRRGDTAKAAPSAEARAASGQRDDDLLRYVQPEFN